MARVNGSRVKPPLPLLTCVNRFFNVTRHPLIAGCSGAWSVGGLKIDGNTMITNPTCGRRAGNNGVLANGTGCSSVDLCAAGWSICPYRSFFS
jgi:hypothetical protein